MLILVHLYIFIAYFIYNIHGLCGDGIKWSKNVKMDDVYGVWYVVGYAQHNPDMTNKPNEIGCVALYITEIENDFEDTIGLEGSIQPVNYSAQNWRSSKSNPWSKTSMAGSWLDVRLKRQVKRISKEKKRVRVLWDEDGHSLEQVYLYNKNDVGLWVAEQMRPFEREMFSRGIDFWYPDDPPRHPDVIRLIKVTPQIFILNHCSEIGNGGIFSLIMTRTPTTTQIQKGEWSKYQQEFYSFKLPYVYRFTGVCAACIEISSFIFVYFSLIIVHIFYYHKRNYL